MRRGARGPEDDGSVHLLAAAYVVDALDPADRRAFVEHLPDCPDCRAELPGLRDAAATLAWTVATAAPTSLSWDVRRAIGRVRPFPPLAAPGPLAAPAPTSTLRPRRRRPVRALSGLAAAAAVVAAVGLGSVLVGDGPPPTATVSTVEQVLRAPDARATSVDFAHGGRATIEHSDSLRRAVVQIHDLAPPPRGLVYQLWLEQPSAGMVPAGVLSRAEDQTLVLVGDAATAEVVRITLEPVGGSTSPTSKALATFDLGQGA